jgi:hypothetical protein
LNIGNDKDQQNCLICLSAVVEKNQKVWAFVDKSPEDQVYCWDPRQKRDDTVIVENQIEIITFLNIKMMWRYTLGTKLHKYKCTKKKFKLKTAKEARIAHFSIFISTLMF